MVKGGGNGLFLLILALRWWMDASDALEDRDLRRWSSNQIQVDLRNLDESMAGILDSTTLQQAMQALESDSEDSDLGMRPKKKYERYILS